MNDRFRIRCRRLQPYEFESPGEALVRVVLDDDSREYRPARLLRVGDLIECVGKVTAIVPLIGGAA